MIHMQKTVADSPFYRVTVKAIIKDGADRLLVLTTREGKHELPGGGWEHHESFEDCIRREAIEELGVGIRSIGPVLFCYRGINRRRGYHALRIAVPVEHDSYQIQVGDTIADSFFVDEAGFDQLDLTVNEGDIAAFKHLIWPNRYLSACG